MTGFQKIRDQVGAMIKCEVSMTDIIGSKAQKAMRGHDPPSLDLWQRLIDLWSRDHMTRKLIENPGLNSSYFQNRQVSDSETN